MLGFFKIYLELLILIFINKVIGKLETVIDLAY